MNDPTLLAGVFGGLTLLFFFLLMTWKIEGMWFSPGSVFATAFICHAFVAPVTMYENNLTTLNMDTILEVQILSIVCFMSLSVGYFMGSVGVRRGHNDYRFPEKLSPQGSTVCSVLLLICVVITVLYSITEGAFSEGKGAWAYSADASYWGRIKAMAAVFIVPLFLTVLACAMRSTGSRKKFLMSVMLISLLVILGHSLLTFARHLVAQLLLVSVIYFHFRVTSIRLRYVLLTIFLLFIVTVFSDIRVFGEGILNISTFEIISQLQLSLDESLSPIRFLLNIAGAIAGQEVFSQVVTLVPGQEDFRYGLTYLESLFSMLTPRVLTGNYEEINTPAFWFKDAYAPYVVNHGFDFSMLSEAYLNFGLLMWMPFLVLGFVLARVSDTIRHTNSQLWLVVNILFLIALITGLRTDSNAMFKTMFFTPAPIFILFFLAKWKVTFNTNSSVHAAGI